MDDLEWEERERLLTSRGAGALPTLIPRDMVERAAAASPKHALARLFLEPQAPSVVATARAMEHVAEWLTTAAGQSHQSWWLAKLRLLSGDDAPGTLAELRAFGALLPTIDTLGDGLDVAPYTAPGKAPDFRIACVPEAVFVEVCCARMNEEERIRLGELDELEARMTAQGRDAALAALAPDRGASVTASVNAEWESAGGTRKVERHHVSIHAMRRACGRPLLITTSTRARRPEGAPKPEGHCHTVASRLAGKKVPGQVPPGTAGILWMDLCDPDWSAHVEDVRPAQLEWRGLTMASTRGIWHAFYGQARRTPMLERSPVSFVHGGRSSSVQVFDGRFRQDNQRCWSAAVLRCVDGIVIFEHPDPIVRLPFGVLRGLVGFEGYSPDVSIHRFAEDDGDAVKRRLDDIERMLAFYAA